MNANGTYTLVHAYKGNSTSTIKINFFLVDEAGNQLVDEAGNFLISDLTDYTTDVLHASRTNTLSHAEVE